METPAALAGATGADLQGYLDWLDHTLARVDAASALSPAIIACDPNEREDLLEAALAHLRAGQPLPPFMGVLASATFWADCASRAELKACTLACFTRLSPSDRNAFLNHVQKEVAA